MNFRSVVLVLFCLSTLSSNGQGFHAGLRAGMTATQVDGDQLKGFDKAGVLAGLTLSRPIGDRTSVGMEMLFIQKGSFKPVNKDDNSYYRMRLSYVEVPFLFRWKAGKKIRLETGPAFGVLVSSQEKDQVGVINYAPPFEKMEYSFHAGLGYSLNDQWMFNARYGFSVLPVRRFASALNYLYWDRGQFNSVIQLSLDYAF